MTTLARRAGTIGIAAAVVTASVTFLACNPEFVAPYMPAVRDTVDYFEYTAPVNGVTVTSRYFWETTGTAANVNLIGGVTAGTAIVTIADNDSAVVFSHPLDGSGVVGTGSGNAGFWNIRVELTNAKGTLHFIVVPQ